MGSKAINGYGSIHFRHTQLGLFGGGFAEIALTPTINTAEAYKLDIGSGQNILSDSRITKTKYELEIKSETPDLRMFELAFGEGEANVANQTYYELYSANVPSTSPYTITLPTSSVLTTLGVIATGQVSSVMAVIAENGTWNETSGEPQGLTLTNLGATGTPTQYQFTVTAATPGVLTFNSALAGAPIVISFPVVSTAQPGLGYTNSPVFVRGSGGILSASMKLISDGFPNGFLMQFPSLSKISGLDLKSADIAEIDNKFLVNIATGYRTPFQMIML